MKRSIFIHGLTGSGVALIATLLYAGLASADSVVPQLQPTQTSPVASATASDKSITADTSSSSTTVVATSVTKLVTIGSPDQPSATGASPVDNKTATAQLVPVASVDPKVASTVVAAVPTIPGSDVVKSLASTSAGVVASPEALSTKIAINPLRLRASSQSISEQGSEPSVVMVAPVVLERAPAPGPTPVRSSGILTQIGELLRHMFAPLVAGFGTLAMTPSGNSSWPIVNFSGLLGVGIASLCYASYLSLLRRSGYQHGARSDEDGGQTYGDAIINGLLSRRVLRHSGQPIFSGVSITPSFKLMFLNA